MAKPLSAQSFQKSNKSIIDWLILCHTSDNSIRGRPTIYLDFTEFFMWKEEEQQEQLQTIQVVNWKLPRSMNLLRYMCRALVSEQLIVDQKWAVQC